MSLQCNDMTKVKTLLIAKKGMACKAFLKYMVNGDVKNIKRQIKAGLVIPYSL